MGLAIVVGVLANVIDEEEIEEVRAELDNLSAALAKEGVDWREPEGLPTLSIRSTVSSFPYSWLHYLRRVLALVKQGRPVTAVDGRNGLDRDRSIIEDEMMMFDSHLLCHSDCEGYYVPVPFQAPVFLPEEAGVAGGGMVGSSQGLLAELLRCAPAIGIQLVDGALADDEARRIEERPDSHQFAIESTVWLGLYEACRASIADGHAIVFS
ncbi:hypothetical protein [Micromonospora sonneratiae]|uniref:Uncharacterized protein n=1 Tax=Micromonospora sonneratiae TaxID=1184706 RepID=A0ABW3YKT0_9ACTN